MKTNLINLIFGYLVRSAGITIGIFTMYGLHILYVFGLDTSIIWVQVVAFLMTTYSVLLFIPLRVLSRNKIVKHAYVGFGICYILIHFGILWICFTETSSIQTLETLISTTIVAIVLLHIKFITNIANQRLHSIANAPCDPVKSASRSE